MRTIISIWMRFTRLASLIVFSLASILFIFAIAGDIGLKTGLPNEKIDPENRIIGATGKKDSFDRKYEYIKDISMMMCVVNNMNKGISDDMQRAFNAYYIVSNRFVHDYAKHTIWTNYIIYFLNITSKDGQTLPNYSHFLRIFLVTGGGGGTADNFLQYTIRDLDMLLKSYIGACDQTNAVMAEILYRMGYEVFWLAIPEHTSLVARINGQLHIMDANMEVTTLKVEEYPGLFAYLSSDSLDNIYVQGEVMSEILKKYKNTEYIKGQIFPYHGGGFLVSTKSATLFERWCEKAKYCLPAILYFVGVLLLCPAFVGKLILSYETKSKR